MSEMRLLMAIVRRKQGEEYLNFFRENGAPMTLSMLCEGTATPSLLEMLGLIQRERELHCMLVPAELAGRLLKRLVTQMHINLPNAGVAFAIPLEPKANDVAVQDNESASEVNTMSAYPHSLIIAIAECGHSSTVMDAARAAGARGGTILHAKGSGAKLASRFFGISIAEEREMIYIVARAQERDAIVKAIAEKAGKATPAQAIVFSLPVETAVGLSVAQEDEED